MAIKAKTLRQRDPQAMAFDARPNAARRLYDHKWNETSTAYRTAHPLCEECMSEGRATPAELVHHKDETVRESPQRRLDWSNLQSLCRPCHGKAHASGGRGQHQ